MKKYFILTCLIMFIAIGLFLRFHVFGNELLWNDEAETTINTMQVMDHGYPSDTYKGKPLYENDSYIKILDPKYALASTNYYGSKFERNKGWLTFYYQAAFIKMFGANTIIFRLPFILLFPFSLIFLYLLSKKLFNRNTALLTTCIYSLNYYSIFYEGQARYYSLTIFLSIFCAYIFYLTITEKKTKYYILSTLGLLLLFYTHIITFIVMILFFLIGHILYHRKFKSLFNKKILISLLALIPLTVPWLILVKIWGAAQVYQNFDFKIIWFIMIGCILLTWWIFDKIFPPIRKIFHQGFNSTNYLLMYLSCILFLKPIIAPMESLSARLLVEAVPIIYVLASAIILTMLKNKKITFIALAGLAFLTMVFYIISEPFKNSVNTYDTTWVKQTIDYLDQKKVGEKTLILVPYQQLSFLLYTDYNVEVIWPLRKSYVDNYPDEIILLYNKHELWIKDTNNIISKDRIIDIGPRTEKCRDINLSLDTHSIECPSLEN